MIQCRVLFLFFVFLIVAIQAELRLLTLQSCNKDADTISDFRSTCCVEIVTETLLSTGTLSRYLNSYMIYFGQ